IVATDSLTGYQPYYKEADSEIWLYDPTAATSETNAAFSGLTNNALYDFAVTAEYNSGSTISSRSPVLQERPGVTSMTISPKHLIISQDAGGSATGEYTVSNPGSRNVSVAIDRIEDLGSVTFTKENYADNNDPDNWDYIWSNIAITRGNSQPVYNPLTDNGYDGDSPDGIKWAWGSTEFVMGNGGLGLNNEGYTECQQCFQRDGPYNQGNQTYYWLSDDNPLNMSSMYLFEENLYFDVEWHSWQRSGGGGGFSYTRTHVPEYGIVPQSGTSITIAPGESETLSKEFSGEEAGLHVSSINFLSDDPDNPRDSIYTLNIVGPQATMPSVHFSPVDATSNIFYYVVQEASIDDLALETGDEIALFSGELCVGAGVYNGVLPFLVKAYGAVPPDVPGFADGDPITVKAWDYGESRTATITAVRNGGSGTFSAGGFSAVSLTGTIYYTQDIQLTSGSFNLVSSYLYPQFPAAGTYFGGITGLGIVYEDNGAAYIPDYGINTIGNVNMVEGYHLYMDGGDQTLTVSGLVIDPANWTITLQPSQFNSIAYLHPAAMDVEDALAAIADFISGEGGIVQDDAGNAWIPSLGVPMGNMTPGKGYQVFTTVDTAVTFTYATYSAPAARDVPEEKRPEPAYFAFRRTGAPYTIVVQSAMIDGHPLEAGDEVAVFDGTTCVGAVVWSEDRPNVLSAWRGNEEYDLPGYLPGNAMNFQV
ncbi:MAG: fibronectin type III domain-containing protein, partial [Alphaproteobacteria bacterium]|nr:fibronectin type III domain-containing protein [Alphaproteobacteria bacterium]